MAVRNAIKKVLGTGKKVAKAILRPIYRKIKQNYEFNYRHRPPKELEDMWREERIKHKGK